LGDASPKASSAPIRDLVDSLHEVPDNLGTG
jgi:hypothetical protein